MVSAVGPTRSLYNKLIGDSMRVEYGQSARTAEKAAEMEAKQAEMEAEKARKKAEKEPRKAEQVTDTDAKTAKTNPKTAKTIPKTGKTKADKDSDTKDSDIHNMASIVSLFQRCAPGPQPQEDLFKMLFTGDAHERDCTLRNTVDAFVGERPQRVDVLKVYHHLSDTVRGHLYIYKILISAGKQKIPHHGSLASTSVEFYKRIYASVYLICARQNFAGGPNFEILEAIVSQFSKSSQPGHIFFSNPDSLYNIVPETMQTGPTSNVNLLLSGPCGPGQEGPAGKYNYRCYILRHRVSSKEKNAGIILLGHDEHKKLIVTATETYWDIWHEERLKKESLEGYRRKP